MFNDENGIIFENGTRSENVTNIDPELLQSILKMKKWYFENNKLLKIGKYIWTNKWDILIKFRKIIE